MSKKTEFVGALGDVVFYKEAIKTAFTTGYFNICALHTLPRYDHETFAGWVRALHCEREAPREQIARAKAYCVNYFLCPETKDEFELEAYMQEIFPAKPECKTEKVIFKIGRYELRKAVAEKSE